jgi:signal transduction histidine kinase
VEKRRILVVDDSPAMRETLCVLLGGSFDVCATSPAEIGQVDSIAGCDLTIASVALRGSTALPPGPILWLGDDPAAGLGRRFTPTQLRRRVAECLARRGDGEAPPSRRDWCLREPFLAPQARAVAERARATGLPLHIAGEPGSGKHAVARALHGGGPFLVCDAARPLPADAGSLENTTATLLAIGVDRWPEESQRALAVALAGAPRLRVISTATRDLDELRDAGAFLPDLYYRLTLLVIQLRPLRERPDDIPALAMALAGAIAEQLGRPDPTFSTAALRRLANYLWFGNVAELQAVLTRTLALAPAAYIDAGDLRFDGATLFDGATPAVATGRECADESADESRAAPAADDERALPSAVDPAPPRAASEATSKTPAPATGAAATTSSAGGEQRPADDADDATKSPYGVTAAARAAASAEAGAAAADSASNLDMIIHELAHEFKNPLVAIKSFTQHCQKSLPEADADEVRFAELTERAAEQMDQVLENLLTFTRMTEPQPRAVALDRLLAPLFANGSGVKVDYIAPPPVLVRVDPEQVSYAIDNLLRALLRDAPPGRRMTAQFCAPDALLCQLPSGPPSAREKLRELVADEGDDGTAPAEAMPLGIALASALLERNGAELRMTREGDPKTVMIRFPLVENEEEVEARNGTSPRIGR